jgi:aspartate-semialdehyde dehydrogenase
MAERKRVGVVGATGIAGQQVLAALAAHPWFQLEAVAASERSTGRTLRQALTDPQTGADRWMAEGAPPVESLDLPLVAADELERRPLDLIFSAVDPAVAAALEPRLAARTPVISTAPAFRDAPDVPILIAGINDDHAPALRRQQRQRGWKGFIAPIPNCTATGLAVSLRPLQHAFGLRAVVMTSMQAVSGAGRSAGGVLALDVLDNVIPFIFGEEEKVELETCKVLGTWDGTAFVPAPVAVSCTCTRVDVQDGHTEAVFVATERPVDVGAARAAMEAFDTGLHGLPSAPARLLEVHADPYRPQPRKDRDRGGGLTVTVGRLRLDPVLGGIKYVLVSHNTKLGAGKGAVLLAEWLMREGYLERAG